MSPVTVTEPAHSLLNGPGSLAQHVVSMDVTAVRARVGMSAASPLNDEQEAAVASSFTERLSLLWGPPGTGKTSTLCAMTMAWIEAALMEGRPLVICVGSSNWTAVDNLLRRIAEAIARRKERGGAFPIEPVLARVRRNDDLPTAVPGVVDVPRESEKGRQLVADIEGRLGIVVLGGTWKQLSRLAKEMGARRAASAPWCDFLILDEASQVKVVQAAGYFLLLAPNAHVVLCGDHRQLGPVYGFVPQDSAQGLFDCIFTFMKDRHGIVPLALRQNYRTNIEIASWPSVRFYGGDFDAVVPRQRLHAVVPRERPSQWPNTLAWSPTYAAILDPRLPVVALTYPIGGFTLSNPLEAQTAAALALLLRFAYGESVSDSAFWRNALGLITPHRAQASAIRTLLRSTGSPIGEPMVATVDSFQGQERDVVIASYSVADRDFIRSEEEFILDPRRFNVTLTRARKKFVLLVSDALTEHLPADAALARSAADLQLFVEEYCAPVDEPVTLPWLKEAGIVEQVPARLRSCGRDEG